MNYISVDLDVDMYSCYLWLFSEYKWWWLLEA